MIGYVLGGRGVVRTVLGVLAVLAVATGAWAQDGKIERGRQLAQVWCAQCHAIGDSSQANALADAPPFQTLAARSDFDEETVRKALLLPLPVMPEFPVTSPDVAALAAYIASLAAVAPAAVPERRTELAPERPVVLVGGTDAAARGHALVMRDCSPCHSVAGPGPSPVADAPAFSTLSQRYPVEFLAEALAEGIMVNHESIEMPQFRYEPDEVGAIIAHLEKVQQ